MEARLRARAAASRLMVQTEELPSYELVALKAGGISDRTLRSYFPRKESMLAFPPPEMAAAIVDSAAFPSGL